RGARAGDLGAGARDSPTGGNGVQGRGRHARGARCRQRLAEEAPALVRARAGTFAGESLGKAVAGSRPRRSPGEGRTPGRCLAEPGAAGGGDGRQPAVARCGMSLRIGIMGGLFNPVHYGHLRAATEARELLALDRVHFLPCAVPPHREAPGVSAELRARMVEAALQGAQGLVLDARELALPAPSYTVRTLEDMHREMPEASFVLLLGEDAFR